MANQEPQAATGQQYGKAKEQLDSQAAVPIPQNVEPLMRPGGAGSWTRPTELPNQPIMTPRGSSQTPEVGESDYSVKIARLMPQLLEAASKATASPSTRNIVNQWKALITPPPGSERL